MHKRKLHHHWTQIRPFRSWYFLVLAGVFLCIGVYGLRQNNLKAIELRDKVAQVDEANGDVEAALQELRQHTHTHMNSSLSGGATGIQQPVQLKYRFERLVEVEKARVTAQNAPIYTEAQRSCEQLFPGSLNDSGRIQCIEEFVAQRGVKEVVVPDALYKFSFVSPLWSPDLAGISLLLSGIFFITFAIRTYLERWLKNRLAQ